MNDQSDTVLLRAYAENHSETAFAELVRRHVDLVYSAALRMVCDSHLAQDVTQGVFVALAKNATPLADRPVLSGWLHRTAQNLAAQTVRTDVRRRAREQEAVAMNELFSEETDAAWERIAPHLDAALGELSESDRDAVLLRYFERKSAREMAGVLGTSEETAQKRVSRAVERLREFFARRGVSVGTSGLVGVLSVNALQAAPAGLALTISTAALAGTALSTSTALVATKAIAMTTLQKTIITVTALGVASYTVLQHQSQTSLRKENQTLREQGEQLALLAAENQRLASRLVEAEDVMNSPKLPAPPLSFAAGAPVEEAPTNLLSRLLNGDQVLRLTPAQAEAFLKENRRSAASLLAAYRTTGDQSLLAEAMKHYPTNAQVAFEAAFKPDATPAERRQWLDAFKQAAPDNVLGNYLSALAHFQSGQTDLAVQDFIAAASKKHFNDYTLDRIQGDEEAFRSAGYTEAETGMAATWGLTLPQLQQLRDAGQKMIELAQSYREAGDEASAQSALRMVVNLGEHFDGSTGKAGVPLVAKLVGLAIERKALAAMDPAEPFAGNQTVQERITQLTRQGDAIKALVKQIEPIQSKMTPQDWIAYNSRTRAFGEENAIQWLTEKYRAE